MPGRDAYYQGLAKGQQAGGFSNGDKGGYQGSTAMPDNLMAGGQNAGQPGGSPYDEGSGFINLSHLLALNGASGQASARSAADKLGQQGNAAKNSIQTAEDQFNQQVNKNTVNSGNILPGGKNGSDGDLGGKSLAFYQDALNKANAGYQGPSSLADTKGYGDLSKQIAQTQGRAQNATTGEGEAAQIAQDTGLSPRQAAASAFYQGVTNPYLMQAGNNFKNLGGLLDQANSRSVQSAENAGRINSQSAQDIGNYVKNVNDYWNSDPEGKEAKARANNQNAQQQAAMDDAAAQKDASDKKKKAAFAAAAFPWPLLGI